MIPKTDCVQTWYRDDLGISYKHKIVREYVFYVFFFKIKKTRFYVFLEITRQEHRKRYKVYQIARTLAYTVRSETNTLYIQHFINC